MTQERDIFVNLHMYYDFNGCLHTKYKSKYECSTYRKKELNYANHTPTAHNRAVSVGMTTLSVGTAGLSVGMAALSARNTYSVDDLLGSLRESSSAKHCATTIASLWGSGSG